MAFRTGRRPRRHSLSQLPESRNPGNEYLPKLGLPSYRMDDFTLQLYAPEYGSYRPKLQVHRDDYDSYDPCDGHKDYDACSEKALADDDLDSIYGTDFLQSPTHNRRASSASHGNFAGGAGGAGGIPMPCCDQCQYYCHVHGTQTVITSCPSTSSATAKRHSYTFGGHNQTMRQRPSPPQQPQQQQQQSGFRHNSQRATYLSESYQLHERLRQLSEPRRQSSETSKKSPGRSRRSSYADGSLEQPPSDAGAYGGGNGGGGAEEARPPLVSRMPPIASLGTLREHPERQRLHKTAPAPGDDDMHRRERWARRRLFGRRPRPAVSEIDEDEYRESWLSRLLSKASQRRGGYRKTLWLNPYGF